MQCASLPLHPESVTAWNLISLCYKIIWISWICTNIPDLLLAYLVVEACTGSTSELKACVVKAEEVQNLLEIWIFRTFLDTGTNSLIFGAVCFAGARLRLGKLEWLDWVQCILWRRRGCHDQTSFGWRFVEFGGSKRRNRAVVQAPNAGGKACEPETKEAWTCPFPMKTKDFHIWKESNLGAFGKLSY